MVNKRKSAKKRPTKKIHFQTGHFRPDSFRRSQSEIAGNDYDLSINRYKEVVYDEVQYETPKKILKDLETLEDEIQKGLKELKGLLA